MHHKITWLPGSNVCRYDLADWAAAKAQFQVAQEKGMSQAMFDCDLKGKDWNGQLKYGTSNFYGGSALRTTVCTICDGGWLAGRLAGWLGRLAA